MGGRNQLLRGTMNTHQLMLRQMPAALVESMRNRQGVTGYRPTRSFKQVNNLHEIIYTSQLELAQRTYKYLERTDKVYKPSETIEFNREGELLLFS